MPDLPRHPHVLVINGSPHENGNTMRLVSAFLDQLDAGARVVNAYAQNIAACQGCEACACPPFRCVLRDDMDEIWRHLAWARVVIWASPLHFTSLSGPLVTLIGRLQPAWHARRQQHDLLPATHPRVGLLLLTAGGKYTDMFEPARRVAAAACVSLGMTLTGLAGAPEQDSHTGFPEKSLRRLANSVQRELAR